MQKILALVLAGGRVDELSVLTLLRPKATVPFGGLYRVIDFPLSNLMHSEIEQIGILSQYRSNSLIHHIGNGAGWDMVGTDRGITVLPPMKGTLSSDWYKGTADAIFQNQEYIDAFDPDLILILSGDHIYKMDYQKLINFHNELKADLTLSFVQAPHESLGRFGQGIIHKINSDGGVVIKYAEKPVMPISDWVSMTIYLFNRQTLQDVLEIMKNKVNVEHFGRDLFPNLIKEKKVAGYQFRGYWAYTRTIDEYWQANIELLDPYPEIDLNTWQVRTNLDNEKIRDRGESIITKTAIIQNSLIHNGCFVEGSVKNSIIFPGVKIEKNASVEDSIIMFDNIIKEGANIKKAICDVNIVIEKNVEIGCEMSPEINNWHSDLLSSGISVIGRNVTIPENFIIGQNCLIYPFKKDFDFKDKLLLSGRAIL